MTTGADLLAEIRDAAAFYRDAGEDLREAITAARVAGVSEDDIRDAVEDVET